MANVVKQEIQAKFNETKDVLERQANTSKVLDATIPGEKFESGHLHPLTLVRLAN